MSYPDQTDPTGTPAPFGLPPAPTPPGGISPVPWPANPGTVPPGWNPPPGYPPYPPQYVVVRPTDGMAVASLVTSIAGFLVCVGLPGVVGALLGHSARRRIRQTGADGDGMALAGIIIGWIGFGLGIALVIFYVAIIAFAITVGSTTTHGDVTF